MLVAYQTDCPSFSGDRRNDLYMYVAVRNVTDEPARFELGNLTLETPVGSFRPVATDAKDFLPQRAEMEPGANVVGYVGFDVRGATVPERLSYADADQRLSVVFDGEPARALPKS